MLIRSHILLIVLASGTGAVDLRLRGAKLQGAPPLLPRITGAPRPEAVKLRLDVRDFTTDGVQVPDCATSCISSAVVSNTNCGLFDESCTCQDANRLRVYNAALPCLDQACGVTNDVLSMLGQVCVSYLRTAVSTASASTTTQSSPSTILATKTAGNGGVTTVTAVINPTTVPAKSASSGGLSKGAIIGIAVGCTIGGLLLISRWAWRIHRCVARRKADASSREGTAEGATTVHQDPPPNDKAELPGHGKPVSPYTVSTTPASAVTGPPRGVSPNIPNASLTQGSVATTPSPPPPGYPPGPAQYSNVSWQGSHPQQPQMYQAVPSAQGGFVMVPVPPLPRGGAVEIGEPGRDVGPVEVAGEANMRGQHELPTQVYSTGPYEMPGPKGN